MSAPKPVVPGNKYNLLTIIEEVEPYSQPNGRLRRKVKVYCDCGSTVEVMLENLYAGYSKSCGCVGKEKTTIHGMSKTRFKEVWTNMKARCDNPQHPQFKDYGGRGIFYCYKWKTLLGFKEDMFETYNDDLTLDREDVNGGYNKENCRWVGMDIQMHNKRKKAGCLFDVIGCHYNNAQTRLVASIQIKGLSLYLATFDSVNDVAKAYDDASENLYKDRPNKTEPKDDWIKSVVYSKLKEKGVYNEN